MCADRGVVTAATVVDHVIPHRGDKDLFFASNNLQSLCEHCHNSHKQRQEKSGVLAGCDATETRSTRCTRGSENPMSKINPGEVRQIFEYHAGRLIWREDRGTAKSCTHFCGLQKHERPACDSHFRSALHARAPGMGLAHRRMASAYDMPCQSRQQRR